MQKAEKKLTRVAFLLNVVRDGAGMINRELGFAGELARRGVKVSVLSYFRPSGGRVPDGVEVQSVVPSRYRDLLYRPALVFPYVFLRLCLLFRRLRPEVVFVDLPAEAWWACLLRPLFGYRVVFTYHGVAASRFYEGAAARALDRLRAFGHRMMRRADTVLVVSDFLLAETAAAGVEARRLHNGVDLLRCSPERRVGNLATTGPVALFVGRYTEYKGALNVVEAFARARREVPDAVLVMHGFFERAAYEQQIRDVIAREAMEDVVFMFGPLEGDEMVYRINLATVFINGSVDETFCMPLLEAQACGVPCLGFAAGGVPEVVLDGKTGLLAREDDLEAMGANLARLLKDTELRATCAAAALAHAATFTYDRLTDRLLELLEVNA